MMSEPLSDEALLAGLASGEADAAAAFVRRFQARVYGVVITIVRDPGTAEDVAQETFVRAWRHAGTYDPRRGRVATWLLTIARNAAIDAIRVRRVEPLDPDVVAARLQHAGAAGGSVDERTPPDERDHMSAAPWPSCLRISAARCSWQPISAERRARSAPSRTRRWGRSRRASGRRCSNCAIH